jgi:hypothetical protein
MGTVNILPAAIDKCISFQKIYHFTDFDIWLISFDISCLSVLSMYMKKIYDKNNYVYQATLSAYNSDTDYNRVNQIS